VSSFTEAIRLGLGWGLVPQDIARSDIAAGRLVNLADGHHLDVPLLAVLAPGIAGAGSADNGRPDRGRHRTALNSPGSIMIVRPGADPADKATSSANLALTLPTSRPKHSDRRGKAHGDQVRRFVSEGDSAT
jgi:hypothetical protein